MENSFLLILIFFLNLIIFFKFQKFSSFFIVLDKPDKKLKKHKNPVSLIGGFIILINLYLIIFFVKLFNLDNIIFEGNFSNIILILGSIFFIIGFLDDLKNLSPNIKLILIIISIFFVTFFFPEIKLENIKISFLKNHYSFGNFSFIFILLSFALLANALNMFDGINLQLICFTLFIFVIFILKGFLPIFFILLSISLIFLGLLNYQNKVFIGDGGCYLISSIIGSTFIYQYKTFDNFLFGDQIFIILLIPSIDMFRLFIVRIIKKKHPFKGDLNHLHHIIDGFIKNKNLTILITLSLCIFPTFLMFLKLETYIILFVSSIIYFTIISFLRIKD
tara:strand:+ start:411 stop:1412 length:1002 start_codon:yes stop_codon:yes gene_type:complete